VTGCKRFEDPAYEEQCVLAFVGGDPPDSHVRTCGDCHAALEGYAGLSVQLRGLARSQPRAGWKDGVRARVRAHPTPPATFSSDGGPALSIEGAASINATRPRLRATLLDALSETEVTTAFGMTIELEAARGARAPRPWANVQWQLQSDLDSARQALVRQIVDRLDDQARTMLRLRFQDEKSDGEIAGILGRDVSAVRATMRSMTRRIALSLRAVMLRDGDAARLFEAATLRADACVIHADLRKLLAGRQEQG